MPEWQVPRAELVTNLARDPMLQVKAYPRLAESQVPHGGSEAMNRYPTRPLDSHAWLALPCFTFSPLAGIPNVIPRFVRRECHTRRHEKVLEQSDNLTQPKFRVSQS